MGRISKIRTALEAGAAFYMKTISAAPRSALNRSAITRHRLFRHYLLWSGGDTAPELLLTKGYSLANRNPAKGLLLTDFGAIATERLPKHLLTFTELALR